MKIQKYLGLIKKTAIYSNEMQCTYPLIGLMGETGETITAIKKYLDVLETCMCVEDDSILDKVHKRTNMLEAINNVKKELGDMLWYFAALVRDYTLKSFSFLKFTEELGKKLQLNISNMFMLQSKFSDNDTTDPRLKHIISTYYYQNFIALVVMGMYKNTYTYSASLENSALHKVFTEITSILNNPYYGSGKETFQTSAHDSFNTMFYPVLKSYIDNLCNKQLNSTKNMGAITERFSVIMESIGSIAEKTKKNLRDDTPLLTVEEFTRVLSPAFIAYLDIVIMCGFSMDEIAQMNYDKLISRLERNVISGSGDNR